MSINKKYLISLDLDGTLLKDNKKICHYTKYYLKKLQREGHIIIFSSGRSYRNVIKYYDLIGLNSPLVLNNGAIIMSPYDTSFPRIQETCSLKEIKSIYSKLSPQYIESSICETYTSLYFDEEKFFDFSLMNSQGFKTYKTKTYLDELKEDPLSFVAHLYPNVKKEEITPLIEPLLSCCGFRFWSGGNYFEVFKKGISKATGINRIAEYYKIEKDNIIVFGDAENDVEMLKEFKNSFLMINGVQELKKYASFITKKDNNHNGIVYSLKEFFRKNN